MRIVEREPSGSTGKSLKHRKILGFTPRQLAATAALGTLLLTEVPNCGPRPLPVPGTVQEILPGIEHHSVSRNAAIEIFVPGR